MDWRRRGTLSGRHEKEVRKGVAKDGCSVCFAVHIPPPLAFFLFLDSEFGEESKHAVREGGEKKVRKAAIRRRQPLKLRLPQLRACTQAPKRRSPRNEASLLT